MFIMFVALVFPAFAQDPIADAKDEAACTAASGVWDASASQCTDDPDKSSIPESELCNCGGVVDAGQIAGACKSAGKAWDKDACTCGLDPKTEAICQIGGEYAVRSKDVCDAFEVMEKLTDGIVPLKRTVARHETEIKANAAANEANKTAIEKNKKETETALAEVATSAGEAAGAAKAAYDEATKANKGLDEIKPKIEKIEARVQPWGSAGLSVGYRGGSAFGANQYVFTDNAGPGIGLDGLVGGEDAKGRYGLLAVYHRQQMAGTRADGRSAEFKSNEYKLGGFAARRLPQTPVHLGGYAAMVIDESGSEPNRNRAIAKGVGLGGLVMVDIPTKAGPQLGAHARIGGTFGSQSSATTVVGTSVVRNHDHGFQSLNMAVGFDVAFGGKKLAKKAKPDATEATPATN